MKPRLTTASGTMGPLAQGDVSNGDGGADDGNGDEVVLLMMVVMTDPTILGTLVSYSLQFQMFQVGL